MNASRCFCSGDCSICVAMQLHTPTHPPTTTHTHPFTASPSKETLLGYLEEVNQCSCACVKVLITSILIPGSRSFDPEARPFPSTFLCFILCSQWRQKEESLLTAPVVLKLQDPVFSLKWTCLFTCWCC